MMTIDELLAGWPTNIPMKGSLIDADGCMCAQGQVLHYIGGMTPDDLREIEQDEADRETAELLGISRAHAVLLRRVNDSLPGAPTCVLTEPEKVLGNQAQRVLAFWRHLDAMTANDWQKVYAARAAALDAAWAAARAAAWAAALDAARAAAWAAAWAAARAAARAAAGASNEIQGAAIMRERGQPFFFLQMFGFASPEEVPL
jgi:hypothetical protein